MMLFTASRQWVLVGVISHSLSCSNTGFPSVAGRLTSYLTWIASMNITGTVTVSAMDPFIQITPTTITTSSSSANLTTTVTSSPAGNTTYNSGYTSFRWLMGFVFVTAIQISHYVYLGT